MIFSRTGHVILFSATSPGGHVVMFGPGGKLERRGDHDKFDDAAHSYTWGFEYKRALADGQHFVFATDDREVLGEVVDGQIKVINRRVLVERAIDGEPTRVLSSLKTPSKPRTLDEIRRGARVLAIFPGVQSPGAGWGTLSHESANNESAYMAHGMSYISSYLKSRDHQVWLLDTRSFNGWPQFIQEIENQEYDFAMLGPLSIEAFTSACIVRVLKEAHPDRPVIFGGLHVSMTKDKVFPPDDLPKFYFYQEPPSRMREFMDIYHERDFDPRKWPKADYVVWNEGELATAAIIEGADLKVGDWDYEKTSDGTVFLNGKIVPDLNTMPHMDRALFDEELEKMHPLLPELPAPFHTITFGRGCPYKCSFCSVGVQFSSTKVRLLEPDYFMEELAEIREANNGSIGSMMIHDDILLFPSWLEEWNEKLKQRFTYVPYWCQMRADFIVKHPALVRHMAEAGMIWCSVGFEVGHARGLNTIMNKELKVIGMDDPVEINIRAAEILTENHVNIFGNFMFGNPTETNEEMDDTVRMIQRIEPQHHGFSTYAGYPGTPMEAMVDRLGLRTNEWYARSHYPWQYRLKGTDYEYAAKCISIAATTSKQYRHGLRK